MNTSRMHAFSTTNVAEAVKNAGLDFTVCTSPVMATTPNVIAKDFKATFIQETSEVLGIVGSDYGVIQNADAFAFGDFINNITWVGGGRTVAGLNYLIGELPVVKINGEEYCPTLVIENGFNGRWKLLGQVYLRNKRGVVINIPSTSEQVTLRHTALVETRMAVARNVMAAMDSYIRNFQIEAEGFMKLPITDAALELVVSDLFPITDKTSAIAAKHQMEKREAFLVAYRDPENDNWRNTAWGVIRAFGGFVASANLKNVKKGGRKAERAFENTLVSGKNYKKVIDVLNSL